MYQSLDLKMKEKNVFCENFCTKLTKNFRDASNAKLLYRGGDFMEIAV